MSFSESVCGRVPDLMVARATLWGETMAFRDFVRAMLQVLTTLKRSRPREQHAMIDQYTQACLAALEFTNDFEQRDLVNNAAVLEGAAFAFEFGRARFREKLFGTDAPPPPETQPCAREGVPN
jgi:hypothetical protein